MYSPEPLPLNSPDWLNRHLPFKRNFYDTIGLHLISGSWNVSKIPPNGFAPFNGRSLIFPPSIAFAPWPGANPIGGNM